MRLLVFDFDGTVSLGDEPVIAYARHLDAASALAGGSSADASIESAVADFLIRDGRVDGIAAGAVDGYAAAARLAVAAGLDGPQISQAYAASRRDLAEGRAGVHAPEGFAAFLDALPADSRTVLVTNAPEEGVAEQLETLGLATHFAERVTSAGKPSRMREVLEGLLATHGARPDELISIGDIWLNDLQAAHALGAATALISRFPAPPEARPDLAAATIEELYPSIAEWAAS